MEPDELIVEEPQLTQNEHDPQHGDTQDENESPAPQNAPREGDEPLNVRLLREELDTPVEPATELTPEALLVFYGRFAAVNPIYQQIFNTPAFDAMYRALVLLQNRLRGTIGADAIEARRRLSEELLPAHTRLAQLAATYLQEAAVNSTLEHHRRLLAVQLQRVAEGIAAEHGVLEGNTRRHINELAARGALADMSWQSLLRHSKENLPAEGDEPLNVRELRAELLTPVEEAAELTPEAIIAFHRRFMAVNPIYQRIGNTAAFNEMYNALTLLQHRLRSPINADAGRAGRLLREELLPAHTRLAQLAAAYLQETPTGTELEQHRRLLAAQLQRVAEGIAAEHGTLAEHTQRHINELAAGGALADMSWQALLRHSKENPPAAPAPQPAPAPQLALSPASILTCQNQLLAATLGETITDPGYFTVVVALDELTTLLNTKVSENLGLPTQRKSERTAEGYSRLIEALQAYLGSQPQSDAPPRHLQIAGELLTLVSGLSNELNTTPLHDTARALLQRSLHDDALAGATWLSFWAICKDPPPAPQPEERDDDDWGDEEEDAEEPGPRAPFQLAPQPAPRPLLLSAGTPALAELPGLLAELRRISLTAPRGGEAYQLFFTRLSELAYSSGLPLGQPGRSPEDMLTLLGTGCEALRSSAEALEAQLPEAPPQHMADRGTLAARARLVAGEALTNLAEMREKALEYFKDRGATPLPGVSWARFVDVYQSFLEFGEPGETSPILPGTFQSLAILRQELAQTASRAHRDSPLYSSILNNIDAACTLYFALLPDSAEDAQDRYMQLLKETYDGLGACYSYLNRETVLSPRGVKRQHLVGRVSLVMQQLTARLGSLRTTVLKSITQWSGEGRLDGAPWARLLAAAESAYRPRSSLSSSPRATGPELVRQAQELLEAGTAGGLGFNANIYRRLIGHLRHIQMQSEKPFTEAMPGNLRLLREMAAHYAALTADCHSYLESPNGAGQGAARRKQYVAQVLKLSEGDEVLLEAARTKVLGHSTSDAQALTWEYVFSQRRPTLRSTQLAAYGPAAPQADNAPAAPPGRTFTADDDALLPEDRSLLAFTRQAMQARLERLAGSNDAQWLADALTATTCEALLEAEDLRVLAEARQPATEEQTNALAQALTEIRAEGRAGFERLERQRQAGLDEDAPLNYNRRAVAVTRVAQLLGIEALVPFSRRIEVIDPVQNEADRPTSRFGVLTTRPQGRQAHEAHLPEGKSFAELTTGNLMRQAVCITMLDALCGLPARRLEDITLQSDNAGNLLALVAGGSGGFGTNTGLEKDGTLESLFLYSLNLSNRQRQRLKNASAAETLPLFSGLALPYYDTELSRRILALEPEDARFALENLITPAETDAFLARLARMQAALRHFMAQPGLKSRFLEPEGWQSDGTLTMHGKMLADLPLYAQLDAQLRAH